MTIIVALVKFLSQHGDPWIIKGIGLIFLLWVASYAAVWRPWVRRHPVSADLFLIIGSSVFLLAPLTQFGAPGGHDLYFHVSRVAELDWLWRDGSYYGRWTPDFNHGFGYPLLNFYPPLIYYIAQILRALGLNMLASLNWVVVSGVWLSGVFMYLLGKEFWGRAGGVVCAIAYLYAPYRIVNLYVRGAIPEFFAMTFMPLLVWSFYKLGQTRQGKYLVSGALGYGGIISAHNVTAVFFTLCLMGYSLFLLFEARLLHKKSWPHVLTSGGVLFGAALLGCGLSAIYWLPAVVETQFVQAGSLQSGYHDVANHFVAFSQFFSRFWGYGGSGLGPADGMSFQLGIGHVLLAILSSAIVLVRRQAIPRLRNQVFFFSMLIFGLLFAMTSPSEPIWRTFPVIGFISFPWRLLAPTAFALSFLCGGFLSINFDAWRIGQIPIPFGNRMMQCLAILVVLAFNVGYCRPGGLLTLSDEQYSRAALRLSDGAALNSEYLPVWVDKMPRGTLTGGEIQIAAGNAEIADLTTDMESYQFTLTAAAPTTLRIGTVYFPGWQAYRDGESLPLAPEQRTGLITVQVPEGQHALVIRFEDTLIRIVGFYLSLGSLVVLGGVALFSARTRRIIAD